MAPMTTLNQLPDFFITSWWEDTWAKGVADWTVNPVLNSVERVGVGLSMSVAMTASSTVQDEVDKFTLAAQSLAEVAWDVGAAIDALLDYALPIFGIWYASLNEKEKAWVHLQLNADIAEFALEKLLKRKVKAMFKLFLLKKIHGFVDMSNALGSLLRARSTPQVLGAARKALEAMGKEADREKGLFAFNPANKGLKAASLLAWIPHTAQRSMVEAKKFERTFPNVRKTLKRPPKCPLSPQDWVYLYFLFADKLNLLVACAEDILAGRPPRACIRGISQGQPPVTAPA